MTRSQLEYLRNVCSFCQTQAEHHREVSANLARFSIFWDETGGSKKEDHVFTHDLGIMVRELELFLKPAEQNIKNVSEHRDLTQMKICTILNSTLLNSKRYKACLKSMRAQEQHKRRLLAEYPEWVQKLVDDPIEHMKSMGQQLAKLSSTATGIGELENYQTGLTVVKFHNLFKEEETLGSRDPFEMRIDSAHDTKFEGTRGRAKDEKKTSHSIRCLALVAQFHAAKKQVLLLEKVFIRVEEQIARFGASQVQYAQLWHRFMGHNRFDYAYSSFVEKCLWQLKDTYHHKCLAPLRNLYSRVEQAISQQRWSQLRLENHLLELQHITKMAVEVVFLEYLADQNQWLQRVVGPRSVARTGDIYREYCAAIEADIQRMRKNDPALADKPHPSSGKKGEA